MKILYVEDNEDNIYMLRARLARAGYSVVVATDGAQGVAMAASERPDLVLMDLSLPVLDGWEAARRIKSGARDAQYSDHRAHRPRHARRSGKGVGGRMRRFRYQAGGIRAAARQDPCARRRGRRVSEAEAALLVIDDIEDNRYALTRRLAREGYTNVATAVDGEEALQLLSSKSFDLVLLDIMMPKLNGYQVLEHMKGDDKLRHVPVIMISAVDEIDSVVRCIELGAADYLPKPFNPTLLRARVGACLERKRLHDQVAAQAADLAAWNCTLEQRVQQQLAEIERVSRLKRFLSPQVADLILSSGDGRVLESHRRAVTVLFCDLRGFTAFAELAEPEEVMSILRDYHAALGRLIHEHEGTVERFAGDAIMVLFNDPLPCPAPNLQAVRMAIEMRDQAAQLALQWRKQGHELGFGVGIAHGYATLGRIGFEGRYDYGAVGTVVNLAARLCADAKDGQILIDPKVRAAIEAAADIEPAGELLLKGFHRAVRAFNVCTLRP